MRRLSADLHGETGLAAEVKVEFANAVRAPHYVHGKTTLAEWKELRAAPAPWG